MYDPILILINKQALLVFGLFCFAYVLYPSSLISRMKLLILGTIQGEIIFSVILFRFNMPYPIGSKEYLDLLAFSVIAFFAGRVVGNFSTS